VRALSRLAVGGAIVAATTHALALAGSARPVIGGVDPGGSWREVVGLSTQLGLPYCSGTLISPRIVLTAAHCLDRVPALAYVGNTPARDGTFVDVESAYAHPDHDPVTHRADIGVVVLARPVPLPTPRLVETMGDRSGSVAAFVGFGFTQPGPSGLQGIKHAGWQTLDAIEDELLRHGTIGCNGDSGGGVFVADGDAWSLAGVISHGDGRCEVGGAAIRVDVHRDWIETQIAELDPPSCGLDLRCVEGCDAPDLDCEDVP